MRSCVSGPKVGDYELRKKTLRTIGTVLGGYPLIQFMCPYEDNYLNHLLKQMTVISQSRLNPVPGFLPGRVRYKPAKGAINN